MPTSIAWSLATWPVSWRPAGPACATTARRARPTTTRLQVFIESYAPPPEMLIFGAVDFTAALCGAAKGLGYRVTVCDAREVFATRARFPPPMRWWWTGRTASWTRVGDRLGPADAVCVLTHDPKFDVPAIVVGAADRRRLPRGDGESRHACPADAAPGRGRASPTPRTSPASWPRSASTSAPAPPRRRQSRCAQRSSRCAPGAPAARCRDTLRTDPPLNSTRRMCDCGCGPRRRRRLRRGSPASRSVAQAPRSVPGPARRGVGARRGHRRGVRRDGRRARRGRLHLARRRDRLRNPQWADGQAGSLAVAVDHARVAGPRRGGGRARATNRSSRPRRGGCVGAASARRSRWRPTKAGVATPSAWPRRCGTNCPRTVMSERAI